MEQQYNLARELHEHTEELRRQALNHDFNVAFERWSRQSKPPDKPLAPNKLAKLEDGVPLWEAHVRATGKMTEASIRTYKSNITAWLRCDQERTSISIDQHITERWDGRVGKDGKPLPMGKSAIGNRQKALANFFEYLTKEGLWDSNPMAGKKLVKPDEKESRYAREEEVVALLVAHYPDAKDDAYWSTMLRLLLDTGLRISEACTLQVDNVDLVNRQMKVTGKGRKERTIPISPEAAEVLARFMSKYSDTEWVFPSRKVKTKQGYWTVNAFQEMMRRMCQKAGIRHLSPHALRHAHATLMLSKGGQLDLVSRELGHADVGITAKVYRHVLPKEAQEHHDRFSPLSGAVNGVAGEGR
jgi:site-specific recombinase XerD